MVVALLRLQVALPQTLLLACQRVLPIQLVEPVNGGILSQQGCNSVHLVMGLHQTIYVSIAVGVIFLFRVKLLMACLELLGAVAALRLPRLLIQVLEQSLLMVKGLERDMALSLPMVDLVAYRQPYNQAVHLQTQSLSLG